jgi:hypothetical protein
MVEILIIMVMELVKQAHLLLSTELLLMVEDRAVAVVKLEDQAVLEDPAVAEQELAVAVLIKVQVQV